MKKNFFGSSFTVCICVIILTMAGCSNTKQAATSSSTTDISQGIDSGLWVFTAEYVLPQGGRSRTTNGVYNVTSNAGKLQVALPYFGTAYAGIAYGSGSPLDFTSTDFTRNTRKIKEGKWQVDIKPNDYREVQSMTFTFFDNGSADLNIILTNRSSIGFRGSIAAKK
jgi:hypothetical protein